MSEATLQPQTIDSPPPAAQPAHAPIDDARTRLHRLAQELMHNRHRRTLTEFLRLRRALR